MSKNKKEILKKWNTINQPGAFSSAKYLAKGLKLKKDLVKSELEKSILFQAHRDLHEKYKKRTEFATYFGEIFEADIADLSDKISQSLTKTRRRVTPGGKLQLYVLIMVDAFTRMVFARGLTTKKGQQVASAIREIFEEIKTKMPNFNGVKTLEVDRGGEFTSGETRKTLQTYGTRLKFSQGRLHKARLSERQVRSFKRIIMAAVQTGKWPKNANWNEVVQMTAENINGRYNRDIKMAPLDIFQDKNNQVANSRQIQWERAAFVSPDEYMQEEKMLASGKGIPELNKTWKLGQPVLVPKKKKERGSMKKKEFEMQYELDIWIVVAIFHARRPLLFLLKNPRTNRLNKHVYYGNELKMVTLPPHLKAKDLKEYRITQKHGLQYKTEQENVWHTVN